jgi:hypothetical protein
MLVDRGEAAPPSSFRPGAAAAGDGPFGPRQRRFKKTYLVLGVLLVVGSIVIGFLSWSWIRSGTPGAIDQAPGDGVAANVQVYVPDGIIVHEGATYGAGETSGAADKDAAFSLSLTAIYSTVPVTVANGQPPIVPGTGPKEPFFVVVELSGRAQLEHWNVPQFDDPYHPSLVQPVEVRSKYSAAAGSQIFAIRVNPLTDIGRQGMLAVVSGDADPPYLVRAGARVRARTPQHLPPRRCADLASVDAPGLKRYTSSEDQWKNFRDRCKIAINSSVAVDIEEGVKDPRVDFVLPASSSNSGGRFTWTSTYTQDYGYYTGALQPEINLVSLSAEARAQLYLFLAGVGMAVLLAFVPLGVQLIWASRPRE